MKYNQINIKENYNMLLKSGMFFEFHPELTGIWEDDKNIILGEVNEFDWDLWCNEKEIFLKEIGYIKYKQNYKNSDFAYWKKFDGYQVGVLFYDYRKYNHQKISIQYECMLIDIDSRIDLSVSKDILITDFEYMSKIFYNSMIEFK